MSFDWKGTFNRSQLERFVAFARAQASADVMTARATHLQVELRRIGIMAFEYDGDGRPIRYNPNPADSYLAKLLAAYEILGGDPFRDLNVRLRNQPVFVIRTDETVGAQKMSSGDVMGMPGLGDRLSAQLMDSAMSWMRDSLSYRREYLERKIRRALDYSDQIQVELLLLQRIVADSATSGSLENIISELQQLISDPNYRPVYDDQGRDPEGKLTGAPLAPYAIGPERGPADTYGKDTGTTGVVIPGQQG